MSKICVSAHAKINLFLDVASKREDGYHNIKSIMQSVDLCDIVHVSYEDSLEKSISVSCSDKNIPTGEKNIAYKAADKMITSGKVNINTDDWKTIAATTGMSVQSAQNIVAYRNKNGKFIDLTDLLFVPRFGSRNMNKYGPMLEV